MATQKQKHVQFLGILFVFVVVSTCIYFLVNRIQPEAYMDEIFHIPQAQRYCNGSYFEVNLGDKRGYCWFAGLYFQLVLHVISRY